MEAQPKIPGPCGRGARAAVSRRSSARPRAGGLRLLPLAIPSARASPPPGLRYFRQQAISMASFVGHAGFSWAGRASRLRGLGVRTCARRRLALRARTRVVAGRAKAARIRAAGRHASRRVRARSGSFRPRAEAAMPRGPLRRRPTARLRSRSGAEPSERDCEARPRGRKNRSRSRGAQRGGRACGMGSRGDASDGGSEPAERAAPARPPAPRGLRAAPRSGTASHETPSHATTRGRKRQGGRGAEARRTAQQS